MIRKTVFYLSLILLPFILLEGATRLSVLIYERWLNPLEERQISSASVITRRNVYLRYDFMAGRSGYVAYDRATINNLGFRGENIDPVRPPDERRVVCLGNSVTFGWGVSDDFLTYPAHLERILRARRPDRRIRVINAGMPRFNSHDLIGVLIQKVVPVQPEIVLILSGWNDLEDLIVGTPDQTLPAGLYLSETYRRFDEFLSWLSGYSRFVYLFRKGAAYMLTRLPPGKLDESEYEIFINVMERLPKNDTIREEGLETFRRALETTLDVCRRHGITPVLLTLPHFFHENMSMEEKKKLMGHQLTFPQLTYAGWFRVITACNETIRAVARKEGVMCFDVERTMDHRYFNDAVHPTIEGYEILARSIADKMDAMTPQQGRPAGK